MGEYRRSAGIREEERGRGRKRVFQNSKSKNFSDSDFYEPQSLTVLK